MDVAAQLSAAHAKRVKRGAERRRAMLGATPRSGGRWIMIKFAIVCYRRPDWSREQFRSYFREVHGPLAMAIPGVRGYVQNFVEADERRDPPWDAVIEFWFDDRASMEAAWRSEAGQRATADNGNLMDLSRTRWAVVEEIVVTRARGRSRGLPTAQPAARRKASAASISVSDSVGWAWMVTARSSAVTAVSTASAASPMSSPAPGPTTPTPSSRP